MIEGMIENWRGISLFLFLMCYTLIMCLDSRIKEIKRLRKELRKFGLKNNQ